jgi:hypothetical protein
MKQYTGAVYRDISGLTDASGRRLIQTGEGYFYPSPSDDQAIELPDPNLEGWKNLAELNEQSLRTVQAELEQTQRDLEEAKARVADGEVLLGSVKSALEGSLGFEDLETLPDVVKLAVSRYKEATAPMPESYPRVTEAQIAEAIGGKDAAKIAASVAQKLGLPKE